MDLNHRPHPSGETGLPNRAREHRNGSRSPVSTDWPVRDRPDDGHRDGGRRLFPQAHGAPIRSPAAGRKVRSGGQSRCRLGIRYRNNRGWRVTPGPDSAAGDAHRLTGLPHGADDVDASCNALKAWPPVKAKPPMAGTVGLLHLLAGRAVPGCDRSRCPGSWPAWCSTVITRRPGRTSPP